MTTLVKILLIKSKKEITLVKRFLECVILFTIPGLIYGAIEILFKSFTAGHFVNTDIRMVWLAGVLALSIGVLDNIYTYETDFLLQGLIGALLATLGEAVGGYQWNTVEGRVIWDYSTLPLSGVAGNVNAMFTIFAWVPLSLIAILLMDAMEYYWFDWGSQPPYYKVFGKVILRFKEKR